MANRLRVGGTTVEPGKSYPGNQVIHLCDTSYENGLRAGRLRQDGEVKAEIDAAYKQGYLAGKQAERDQVDAVMQALAVLKDYFQNTEVSPQEPYPEFIGRRLRDIILEKLPAAATDICHGGVAGCPSDYSYFNRTYDCTPNHTAYDDCNHESCTACWNQVYVGKDKEGNW